MDSSQRKYRILNDVNANKYTSSCSSFPQFSQLPLELRLKIWTFCFPTNRFISILITRPVSRLRQQNREAKQPQQQLFTAQNHLGNLISGDPYHLTVSQFRPWASSLLSVSREARQAFVAFYRVSVHLTPDEPSLLRLNPDTDILEIQLAQAYARVDALVAFFHDLVASDPRGVGIAHLAMGRNMNDIVHLCDQDPSTLHPSAAQSLKRLLSRSIRTFYACIAPGTDARNMLGLLSWPCGPIHQNRSTPLMPHFQNNQAIDFDLLARDPRPIQTDLTHVAVGVDPRRNVFLWRSLLAKYDVPPSSIPIRYLYAVWPFHKETNMGKKGRLAFIEFLRATDARWAKWMADLRKPLRGERLSEEEHARLGRDLPEVAGFWVFGPGTFGVAPDVGSVALDSSAQWKAKMVVDLTQHVPELGVFQLDA
ncbi:hypothetical protein PG993_011967 [Apiospora rasikravindrae]|uniref:2EXR domain-containing protein n=1 Tax=Apiospora rasikravindrae TaxID=990691 RepID=A0ABR1S2S5_9PEZI